MNYLLRLGERFLALQRYEQEEELIQCHTLDQFVDRKLTKHYNYLLRKATKAIEDSKSKNGESYYYQYLMGKAATNHFYSLQVRKFDPSLQTVSDQLDQFYFFQKLRYSCEMLNRQTIIRAEYELNFVDEVQEHLLKTEEIDPLIEIYLRIYLSIKDAGEEEHFRKLIQLIETHANSIDQKIKREIYLYAINFCAPKIRRGDEKYTSIMLDLYIKGIHTRALFGGDYLSHWTYSNVVKLALRLQRYDWTENFIREQSINLPPEVREGAEHYNLAELYYHQAAYDKVLDQLNMLQHLDPHHQLGSRVILLKTYYAMEAEEPLLSLLSSFSVYLRRNRQISTPMKKTYLNFCNLLHQIMRRNPKKWNALGEEIQQTQPLAERA
ncbi:MAG: hypothetical protein KTR30_18215, partial [Saprospiraceae bacterium]|nr:hypothetical protein [Saprospiraceae bacterium]